MRICFITPVPPLRGGISTSSNILINHLEKKEIDLLVISFSKLYPNFFFPGKTQYNRNSKNNNTLFLIDSKRFPPIKPLPPVI